MGRALAKKLAKKLRNTHFDFGDGNATVVGAMDFDTNTYYYGVSFCVPSDNFSRAEGCNRARQKFFDRNSFFSGRIVWNGEDRTCDLALAALRNVVRLSRQFNHHEHRWYYDVNCDSDEVQIRTRRRNRLEF